MTDERLKEIEKLYAKLCEEEGEEGEVAEEPSYDDLVEALPVLGELLAEVRSQKEQWRQDLDVTRGRLREAEEKVTVCHDCYWELARTTGYNGDTSEHADVMAWAEDHRNALATADVRYNELARAAGYPRDIVGHVDVLEWVRSRRREGVA
jgi:hypothetical protein